jgi:hypothetical protein
MAITVLVWAALAPTVSLAFEGRSGPSVAWQEFCTALDSVLVYTSDVPGAPKPGDVQAHIDHCPFCLSDACIWLPPAQAFPLAMAAAGQVPLGCDGAMGRWGDALICAPWSEVHAEHFARATGRPVDG